MGRTDIIGTGISDVKEKTYLSFRLQRKGAKNHKFGER
jgi:hypothetical protein